jgi:hypothetical protein
VYWKDLQTCHSIDLMHVTKNVFDSIIGTLLDMPRKSKDGLKDIYDNVVTSVQTSNKDTNVFPINIGLHQGSALSPYLFALVMDEVTRDIQGGIPWCMLFADDVVLVDESRTGVDQKLELWRRTLEVKGFMLSRYKTKYMKCDFSATTQEEGMLDLMVR